MGLDKFPGMPEVAETGLTFADNALLKARAVAAFTGLPAVADDSGLCVDALHGMPGIFSARWSGGHGDDRANLELLLGQLADVSERGGQFVCAAVLVLPDTVLPGTVLPRTAAAGNGRRPACCPGRSSASLAEVAALATTRSSWPTGTP